MTQSTPGPISRHDELAEKVIAEIRALNDPLSRVQSISDVLNANGSFVSQLATLTHENVAEMHEKDGLSYGQIAKLLGISRSRAQQLANGTR